MGVRLRNSAVFSVVFVLLAAVSACHPVFAAAPNPCDALAIGEEVGAYRSPAYVEPSDLAEKYERVRDWISATQRDVSAPFLSIVIPAYKEEKRIGASIRHLKEFFDRYPLPVEIRIAIERSPDKTVEVAREAVAADSRFIVQANEVQRGKGFAVRSGIEKVTGDVAVFMDADLSTPLYEVIRFLDWMRTHPETDIVIGDRVKAIAAVEHSRSVLRKAMTAGFHAAISMASPLKFPDTQAGFKMLRRPAYTQIFNNMTIDGFAFDIEMLITAQELGFKVEAVDIDWVDDRRSTVRPLIDPILMLRDILKVQSHVRARIQNQFRNTSTEAHQ